MPTIRGAVGPTWRLCSGFLEGDALRVTAILALHLVMALWSWLTAWMLKSTTRKIVSAVSILLKEKCRSGTFIKIQYSRQPPNFTVVVSVQKLDEMRGRLEKSMAPYHEKIQRV